MPYIPPQPSRFMQDFGQGLGIAKTLQGMRESGQELDLKRQQIEQQGQYQKTLGEYHDNLIDQKDMDTALDYYKLNDFKTADKILNGNKRITDKFGTFTSTETGVKTTTLNQFEVQTLIGKATDPETGKIDPNKAWQGLLELKHGLGNKPQEARSSDQVQVDTAQKLFPGDLESQQRWIQGQKAGLVGVEANARAGERRTEKLNAPLEEKASKYIHRQTGERATPDMTHGDVTTPGSDYMALSASQEKIYESLNTLKTHADLSEQYLDQFPKGGIRGINSLKMWLRTQANDPAAVGLNVQLEAMTPLAISRALAGSGGRGGAILAKMLKEAAFTGGETVDTAKEKLKNMRTLSAQLAKENGLPVAPFQQQGGAPQVAPGKTSSPQRLRFDANGNPIP